MTESPPSTAPVTAAMLIIGNEILSGRTKDKNVGFVAEALTAMGIRLSEVRVVRDDEAAIIEAVTTLSERYTYVFTSGGIGPTHDDITTACIAKAFDAAVERNPEAMRRLTAHYANSGVEFNAARQKMAEIPVGAGLIDNPVSAAPGFIIKNVHVMAGVPRILQAMFEGLKPTLIGGAQMLSRTVACTVGEGAVAGGLGQVQVAFPAVEIGSYPYFRAGAFGTSLVLRGTDEVELEAATEAVRELVRSLGGEPIDIDDGAESRAVETGS
ncbi:MAG: molybdopterin-binding protein [Thalassobaculaceae bacterium]|nr:molybdopterin-binding protein [Thalassobaculaceae bacterium]